MASDQTITLSIQGMTCGGCAGRVNRALEGVKGVASVAVNLANDSAVVRYAPNAVTPEDLALTSTQAGYPAELARADAARLQKDRRAAEARILRRDLMVAAALTLPVFATEMGGHLFPALHHAIHQNIGMDTFWGLQFVLITLVLIGPGRVFFAKGLPALWRRAPDMNALVALGTGAAWGFSTLVTFAPALFPPDLRAVYFEAAGVIVVLILLGRWLEARAKGRTGAAIEALLGLRAPTVRILQDGQPTDIPHDDLNVGDVILVRPGERIATDATITDGAGLIDESMITGEPLPVSRGTGDLVTGGTVNGTTPLTVRATRVGADTTLAQIIRMVEEAQGARLPIQTLVDTITIWFVPAVIGLALLTVGGWLMLGPDPALTFALVAGVSVLIIACPCAMGLATPTSIMVGTGRGAEMGVLFRKGDALQALSGVKTIAFDKTGTLTEGRPTLTTLKVAQGFERDTLLPLIAAAEAHSEHPIAGALMDAAPVQGDVADVTPLPGLGLSAWTSEGTLLIGSAALMAHNQIQTEPLDQIAVTRAQAGDTVLFAALGGKLAAVIAVSDPIKASTEPALAALKARGIQIAMITGDGEATARAIADRLGIDHVTAGVRPDGKVAALKALADTGTLAFVGDGINDAPALAAADVGLAIGTGTDVAIEAADVVLMSGDLMGVANAHHVSRQTLRNIRQNLAWAFGYNAALIPVAAGVFYPVLGVLLSPGFAAGAMALSSVSVLSNALRLRRLRPL